MHEVSRHAGHLVEVHAATIETMESMLHRQRTLYEAIPWLDKTYKVQANEYLSFQLRMMRNLHRRSLSIQERIHAEITLVFS